jgi:hypothetical protein
MTGRILVESRLGASEIRSSGGNLARDSQIGRSALVDRADPGAAAHRPGSGNHPADRGVRGGMPKIRLPLATVTLALVTGACAAAAAPPSPGASTPPPSPTQSGVDHPTGATDVVLRMEVGGGFVPIDFAASQAPTFTLYGDGRVVFQQLLDTFPQPGPDGITHNAPWRTAQLDEGQIEELLMFALGPGGLGTARDSYIDNGIADAANTIFTIDAGGLEKTVVVNAIEMEPSGGPDDAARASLKKLADRLHDFDEGGTISTDVYAPTGYRGVLIEQEVDPNVPGPKAIDWPWPDLTVADFKEGDGSSGPAFPHKALTGDEIAALKVGDVSGGAQGLIVKSPEGKTYSLIVRPLLPDESE